MTSITVPTGRRIFLRRAAITGAVFTGAWLAASPLVSLAVSPAAPEVAVPFMQVSRLLINHTLDDAVGARIAAAAAKARPNLAALMQTIADTAKTKQATAVEDFFDAIPEGEARDLAHWIIFAWYTGSSSAKPDAQVFTYEQALTFQTTADVVAIPSFGLAGPNRWRQDTVALSPLPTF